MLDIEAVLPEPARSILTPIIAGLLTAFTFGGAMFMVIWPKKLSRVRPDGPGPIRIRLLGIFGVLFFLSLGWSYFFGK